MAEMKTKRRCTHPRREARRQSAMARKSYMQRGLTPMERLAELDRKFGVGKEASTERAKLAVKIAKLKEAKEVKKAEETKKVEQPKAEPQAQTVVTHAAAPQQKKGSRRRTDNLMRSQT